MYRYLLSEKGFTAIEILTVVVILGILTAVGVPVFTSIQKTQEINDCKNQRTVIQALVKEAMYGMVDNGMPQYKIVDGVMDKDEIVIDFAKVTRKTTLTKIEKDTCTKYQGEDCFVLVQGDDCFTLGELRGGYRDGVEEYEDGCKLGNYLKKEKYADTPFYLFLSNEEVPVCPRNNSAKYYIFADGTVVCSCHDCHEAED